MDRDEMTFERAMAAAEDKRLDPPADRCPERISIECFEGRHADCDWDNPGACGCTECTHGEISIIEPILEPLVDVDAFVDALQADLPMRIVCAWCGVELREGRSPASHGICQRCASEQFPGMTS